MFNIKSLVMAPLSNNLSDDRRCMHEIERAISPFQDVNVSTGANAAELDLEAVIFSTSLAIVNDSYGYTSDVWPDIARTSVEPITSETSLPTDTFSRSISSFPAMGFQTKETRQKNVSSSFHQVKGRGSNATLKVRCQKARAPQRLFTNDIHMSCSKESVSNPELSRTRLTTNVARKVEMMEPISMIRKTVFKSCSDAAKHTGINRTKLSRSEWPSIHILVSYRITFTLLKINRTSHTNVVSFLPALSFFFPSMPIRRRYHNESLLSVLGMWQCRVENATA
jgi:hypothetical protein